MSAGRKKSSSSKIKVTLPPQPQPITEYQFQSPLGDTYTTSRQDGVETSTSVLSSETQGTINSSKSALLNLAQDMNVSDATRAAQIEQRGRDFYDLQAKSINESADKIFSGAQSDLNKRFGGSFTSTFGSDYLSSLEKNRLSQLADSSKEASLLSEDLYQQDEDSRIRRFNLFNDYLTAQNNLARNISNTGSSVLSTDASNSQNYAINSQELLLRRANLLQQAQQYDDQADLARRNQVMNWVGRGATVLFGM